MRRAPETSLSGLTAGSFRRISPLAALLFAAVLGLAAPPPARSGVAAGAVSVRAEGRAPILRGRADLAHGQALDEAFRRAILETLRTIAPELQRPQDLETWQETVLPRAADFVGSWRILSEEQRDGFLQLEAEVEIWRDQLALAAATPRMAAAVPAVRLLVLADSYPILDPADDEEVDAGRHAAAALEAELARRGAIIVSTTERTPWEQFAGPDSEERRAALAAAAANRLGADAVLVARLTRSGGGFALQAQLIAVASKTTIGTASGTAALTRGTSLADAFAPVARQIGADLAARLAALHSGGRAGSP